jgi:hypothetical protein
MRYMSVRYARDAKRGDYALFSVAQNTSIKEFQCTINRDGSRVVHVVFKLLDTAFLGPIVRNRSSPSVLAMTTMPSNFSA